MKRIIQKLLAALASRILSKYKPKVIGITGSVGKTSTKEAVFLVVSQKFKSRKSEKNFNTEFGVPFTIVGAGDPARNVFKWLYIFFKATLLILLPLKYPKLLVLELGVEFPGDMATLMDIVHPNIGIITSIGISHYEFFKNQDAITAEKGKLAETLGQDEILLLNADDAGAMSVKSKTKAKIITYGMASEADVKVTEITEQLEEAKYRTFLKVSHGAESANVTLHAIGKPHIQAIISAVAVGFALGVEKDLIERGLSAYKPIPGRLNIFPGLKHSTILDDTYNASPDSMRAALEVFGRLAASYKIAVLGDMLELGEISEAEHTKIGVLVPLYNVNRLVTIGPGGKQVATAALAAGLPESKISIFETSDAAKRFVSGLIEPEALILVKGSQGVRLEKITKEIMAEPMRAHELLPRQYGKWLEVEQS